MLKEGEQTPEIYTDAAFSRTNHWELSTSQLSSPFIDGWGYGEVVPDGYGLSYSIGDDYLRWSITSKKSDNGKELRTKELKHHLADAATDVRRMMERAKKAKEEGGKPKL
jgi:carnitine O-acetyltransferase